MSVFFGVIIIKTPQNCMRHTHTDCDVWELCACVRSDAQASVRIFVHVSLCAPPLLWNSFRKKYIYANPHTHTHARRSLSITQRATEPHKHADAAVVAQSFKLSHNTNNGHNNNSESRAGSQSLLTSLTCSNEPNARARARAHKLTSTQIPRSRIFCIVSSDSYLTLRRCAGV